MKQDQRQKQSKNVKTSNVNVYEANFVSPSPSLPNHCIGFASIFEGYKKETCSFCLHINIISIKITIAIAQA